MRIRLRMSRRAMLGTLGALGVAAATRSLAVAAPGPAAQPTLRVHEAAPEALKRLFGTRPLKDGSGVVKLEAPLIAENGALVPVTVEVSSPMTPARHVKHI